MDYKELVHRLISISLVHRCRISKSAHKVNLYYGQPVILEFIGNNPRCTQKDLADGLFISPASAATSLKRLEKAGLVIRIPNEADSRKNNLTLTEEGVSALGKFHEICKITDEKMFEGFSEEELKTLDGLLKRLYRNLDASKVSREEINKMLTGETDDA